MSLARARRGRYQANYWPGFVDMLSTLLLVVTFLMSLFMLTNFIVSQASSGKDTMLSRLNRQLAELTELQLVEAPGTAGVAPQVRFALLDMQRSLSDLNDKVELRLLNDNTGDAVKDLAAGVDKLIRQMRAEQKVVREWADEQAQQQHELATVLRQITDKAKLPAREERK